MTFSQRLLLARERLIAASLTTQAHAEWHITAFEDAHVMARALDEQAAMAERLARQAEDQDYEVVLAKLDMAEAEDARDAALGELALLRGELERARNALMQERTEKERLRIFVEAMSWRAA